MMGMRFGMEFEGWVCEGFYTGFAWVERVRYELRCFHLTLGGSKRLWVVRLGAVLLVRFFCLTSWCKEMI